MVHRVVEVLSSVGRLWNSPPKAEPDGFLAEFKCRVTSRTPNLTNAKAADGSAGQADISGHVTARGGLASLFHVASVSPAGDVIIALDSRGAIMAFHLRQNRFSVVARTGARGAALAFHPRRRHELFVACADNRVACFHVLSGALLFSVCGDHQAPITSVAVQPVSGASLLTCSRDVVTLWDLQDVPKHRVLRGGPGALVAAKYTPSGSAVVALFDDDSFSFWDAKSLLPVGTLSKPVVAGSARLHARGFDISPDGRFMAVVGRADLLLWDLCAQGQQPQQAAPQHQQQQAVQTARQRGPTPSPGDAASVTTVPFAGAQDVQFLRDSCMLAVRGADGRISFLDVRELPAVSWHIPGPSPGGVLTAFSRKALSVGAAPATKSQGGTAGTRGKAPLPPSRAHPGGRRPLFYTSFSTDASNRWAACVTADGTLALHDLWEARKRRPRLVAPHARPVVATQAMPASGTPAAPGYDAGDDAWERAPLAAGLGTGQPWPQQKGFRRGEHGKDASGQQGWIGDEEAGEDEGPAADVENDAVAGVGHGAGSHPLMVGKDNGEGTGAPRRAVLAELPVGNYTVADGGSAGSSGEPGRGGTFPLGVSAVSRSSTASSPHHTGSSTPVYDEATPGWPTWTSSAASSDAGKGGTDGSGRKDGGASKSAGGGHALMDMVADTSGHGPLGVAIRPGATLAGRGRQPRGQRPTRSTQPQDPRPRLTRLLETHGEYPGRYRGTIWRMLLALPGNADVFARLADKGAHPALADLATRCPIPDTRLFQRFAAVMHALVHWSPVLGEAPWVPSLAFPFVKACSAQGGASGCKGPASEAVLVSFEVVATLVTNWCRAWFEHFPRPPTHVLAAVEVLLAHADPPLLAHLHAHEVCVQGLAWDVLRPFLSECLSHIDWLVAMDHVLSNDPEFLLFLVTAFFVHMRAAILAAPAPSLATFGQRSHKTLDVRALLRLAYTLRSTVPDALQPEMPSFAPLPMGGHYPLFDRFPVERVVSAVQQREWLQLQEEQVLRKRRLLAQMGQATEATAAAIDAAVREVAGRRGMVGALHAGGPAGELFLADGALLGGQAPSVATTTRLMDGTSAVMTIDSGIPMGRYARGDVLGAYAGIGQGPLGVQILSDAPLQLVEEELALEQAAREARLRQLELEKQLREMQEQARVASEAAAAAMTRELAERNARLAMARAEGRVADASISRMEHEARCRAAEEEAARLHTARLARVEAQATLARQALELEQRRAEVACAAAEEEAAAKRAAVEADRRARLQAEEEMLGRERAQAEVQEQLRAARLASLEADKERQVRAVAEAVAARGQVAAEASRALLAAAEEDRRLALAAACERQEQRLQARIHERGRLQVEQERLAQEEAAAATQAVAEIKRQQAGKALAVRMQEERRQVEARDWAEELRMQEALLAAERARREAQAEEMNVLLSEADAADAAEAAVAAGSKHEAAVREERGRFLRLREAMRRQMAAVEAEILGRHQQMVRLLAAARQRQQMDEEARARRRAQAEELARLKVEAGAWAARREALERACVEKEKEMLGMGTREVAGVGASGSTGRGGVSGSAGGGSGRMDGTASPAGPVSAPSASPHWREGGREGSGRVSAEAETQPGTWNKGGVTQGSVGVPAGSVAPGPPAAPVAGLGAPMTAAGGPFPLAASTAMDRERRLRALRVDLREAMAQLYPDLDLSSATEGEGSAALDALLMTSSSEEGEPQDLGKDGAWRALWRRMASPTSHPPADGEEPATGRLGPGGGGDGRKAWQSQGAAGARGGIDGSSANEVDMSLSLTPSASSDSSGRRPTADSTGQGTGGGVRGRGGGAYYYWRDGDTGASGLVESQAAPRRTRAFDITAGARHDTTTTSDSAVLNADSSSPPQGLRTSDSSVSFPSSPSKRGEDPPGGPRSAWLPSQPADGTTRARGADRANAGASSGGAPLAGTQQGAGGASQAVAATAPLWAVSQALSRLAVQREAAAAAAAAVTEEGDPPLDTSGLLPYNLGRADDSVLERDEGFDSDGARFIARRPAPSTTSYADTSGPPTPSTVPAMHSPGASSTDTATSSPSPSESSDARPPAVAAGKQPIG
eukprot:jgi/Mesvir1/23719/Mv18665-RA.2